MCKGPISKYVMGKGSTSIFYFIFHNTYINIEGAT